MKLAMYKKNHTGFHSREVREFVKFPSKEEAIQMGVFIAHAMNDAQLELHRSGKFRPEIHTEEIQ